MHSSTVLSMVLLMFLVSCGESVEPVQVPVKEKQLFEKNPTDSVGVAEGDEQVSPFGKPAH